MTEDAGEFDRAGMRRDPGAETRPGPEYGAARPDAPRSDEHGPDVRRQDARWSDATGAVQGVADGSDMDLPPERAALLGMCREGLDGFLAAREEALDLIDRLIASDDARTREAAGRYRDQLVSLEPSVTLIGQVKAGKTSLLNAMIGAPGLLPADVNPWTSVVTSLHVGAPAARAEQAARFTFFDPEDWARLTHRGGRVGELAGRSGAEDEAEKIRAQVEEMRARTRRRLGRRFELLLGTSHDYDRFDPALIERYVCLGDDFIEDDAALGQGTPQDDKQGRFADLTKAADLWIPREDMPLGLCLRDTPGVNDTFMMREQITIRAIRDSRLSVVVLSAHQALSSVDMALIRLISNVRSREAIIFVNRVDELSDPTVQIEEIRNSIRETLANHGDLADVQILFGSARWATLAMTGELTELEDEAAEALLSHAEAVLPGIDADLGPMELIWWLSGVPELYRAIWGRIAQGPARERLQSVARAAMNLAVGLEAAANASPLRLAAETRTPIDGARLEAQLSAVEARVRAEFEARFQQDLAATAQRLDRSHRAFLDRATSALVKHLDTKGELSPWSYDPTGLRLLMRTGYQVFARALLKAGTQAARDAAAGVAAIYAEALGKAPEDLAIQPPTLPRLAPPVLLGQTIALDLQSTWWRRWWNRRRGYEAYAPEFHAMIEAETRPIVEGLRESHCRPAGSAIDAALATFFEDQRIAMSGLAQGRGGRADDRARPPEEDHLSDTVTRLGRLAA